MCASKATSNESPEKPRPVFVPNQTRRTFFQSRFYYKLRYILRFPFSTGLGSFLTGTFLIAGAVNLGTYLWFGPGHPLNRYQWEKMKERGELSPELLEKERLLKLYSLDKYHNPKEPLPQQKILRMPSKEITHVIFDYDGVLQDTEMVYSIANDVTLKKYERSFNNVLKAGMMGRRRDEAVRWILQQTGLADKVTPAQYDEAYEKTLDEYLPKAPVLPGVDKVVDYFTQIKMPLAICTGSDTHEFEQKSRNLKDFISKFQFVVLAGDDPEVKMGKPAPDPYLVTMSRFPTPPASPANVLVFEDSLNGVRSALAAGCKTIFVPQEAFKTHDWEERIKDIKTQVVETLKSLEDFDPTKYGLPAL